MQCINFPGFGYTDIRQQEPVTPNHQFRFDFFMNRVLLTTYCTNSEWGLCPSQSPPRQSCCSLIKATSHSTQNCLAKIQSLAASLAKSINIRDMSPRLLWDIFWSTLQVHMKQLSSPCVAVFLGGWDNLQSDAAWVQPDMTTKELIEYVLTNVPLEYKPGTMWIYSNFGYQLLGKWAFPS